MVIIPTDIPLTYTFSSGTIVTATIENLKKIAKNIGESIDELILIKGNSLENKWYYSSTADDIINVNDMNIEHVKAALLKSLRNYYTILNFTYLNDEEWIEHLVEPQKYDSDIDMLINIIEEKLQG